MVHRTEALFTQLVLVLKDTPAKEEGWEREREREVSTVVGYEMSCHKTFLSRDEEFVGHMFEKKLYIEILGKRWPEPETRRQTIQSLWQQKWALLLASPPVTDQSHSRPAQRMGGASTGQFNGRHTCCVVLALYTYIFLTVCVCVCVFQCCADPSTMGASQVSTHK